MTHETPRPSDIFNNEDSNTTSNPTFDSVLSARLSRRNMLRGGASAAASAMLGGVALTGCATGAGDAMTHSMALPGEKLLGFPAVAKSLADVVSVPPGYKVEIIYALGDPILGNAGAFKNDGSDADFDKRAGDHHDGMEWFGLSENGQPSRSSVNRGLLAVNHEATTDEKLSSFFIHTDGGKSTLPRPAAEVDKETAIHGISVVEVRKSGDKWTYLANSPFNRRLTQQSDIEIAGPARGNRLMVTKYSPTGTKTRGTLNNCGTGLTPWGTFLTGEENWAGYFHRTAGDDARRNNDKSATSLRRYGRGQGAASRHGWETGGTEDKYARWNNSKIGTSADGSDDYRNEMNGQGYVVEMDVYDTAKLAKKRTALGRYAHESAVFSKAVAGQPLAVYMGDDARNEYIYKFVSDAKWDPADANPANRMSAGDKYLDSGKLYTAKFNSDGTGQWIELSLNTPAVKNYTAYPFADQADICVNTRLAADAAGATKMDRPEWCGVNPKNGEVYFTLTNNSNRSLTPAGSSQLLPDASNPRVYTDMKNGKPQSGNPNGHILRLREAGNSPAATTLTWDIYVFGAEAGAPASPVNLSNLTDDQDMSSPDGLWFSPSTGICWIQTDDGAYTDKTNCMMLAALPGQVGDGKQVTLNYPGANGNLAVQTQLGKSPTANTLKRFLVGPAGCEITGACETPDGKALFINIQHPGEGTPMAAISDPAKYQSQWPSNAGYGPGKRPRSATIVITKADGGRIGT